MNFVPLLKGIGHRVRCITCYVMAAMRAPQQLRSVHLGISFLYVIVKHGIHPTYTCNMVFASKLT